MINKEVLKRIGIDYEKGLTYFGQDEVMYQKYLLDFANETYIERAIQELKDQNIKDAFHSVHSIKSLVEYVSIPKLDTIVHEITETLRLGKTDGVMDGLMYIQTASEDIKEVIIKENKSIES